jgi:hypothetical protein
MGSSTMVGQLKPCLSDLEAVDLGARWLTPIPECISSRSLSPSLARPLQQSQAASRLEGSMKASGVVARGRRQR